MAGFGEQKENTLNSELIKKTGELTSNPKNVTFFLAFTSKETLSKSAFIKYPIC